MISSLWKNQPTDRWNMIEPTDRESDRGRSISRGRSGRYRFMRPPHGNRRLPLLRPEAGFCLPAIVALLAQDTTSDPSLYWDNSFTNRRLESGQA